MIKSDPRLHTCVLMLDVLDAASAPTTLHWLALRLALRPAIVREALAHLVSTGEVRIVQRGTRKLYTTTTTTD